MSERGPNMHAITNRPADFTVHQLTIFCTVASHLSYTKAAEVLYLSQPSVSQQVKTLEIMVGLQLFARSGRGIILTPAGQEFLRHAERLLALLAETAPVVREIQALTRGSVLVGASTTASTYVVIPLLGAFHARYPRIHITLTVAERRSIEEHLLTHQVDLAVMSLVERQDHFVMEPLMPHELVIVAKPSHRLAGRTALTVDDLRQETFLLREQGSVTSLLTDRHFALAGVPLQASLELGSIEAIKQGVIAELGLAIVPREAITLEITNGDLTILDVEGFPLKRRWYVVHAKERRLSRGAIALQQLLLQHRIGL